ncbi:unnamed protein product [Bemisia tabaci]|uniref:Uncharacterized protein n=1 Tax=Bemisia tabaci TaxID=7038 RepID=A0A9P0FZY9_BEMTA|nr:unnamed protein product [Bemisia tabaci]
MITVQFSGVLLVVALYFGATGARANYGYGYGSSGYGSSSTSKSSNQCWNYESCQVNTCPWTRRRYYAVFVSPVTANNFWGNGNSCGVFNQCTDTGCGCVGVDVYSVNDKYIEGSFFSYDKSKTIQYMRSFSGTISGKSGYSDVVFTFSQEVTWTVPAHTVKNCEEKSVSTYVVPAQSVQKKAVNVQVKAIHIAVADKYRILVFCGDLKGINGNKPFAVVLTTMPMPGQATWKLINADLRKYKFEPRSMVFISQSKCVYPPFEWCAKQSPSSSGYGYGYSYYK